MPAISTLVDDFNDNTVNTTLWANNFGTVSETGGRARIACDTGFNAYSSALIYTLDESQISLRAYAPAAGGATTEAWAQVLIKSSTGGTDLGFELRMTTGDLVCFNRTGFFDAEAVAVTYSPTDHAWLRVREVGGTTFWETSPNGTSWTTRRTSTSPTWVADTDLEFQLISHRSDGTDDFAEFDNVNTGGLAPTVRAAGLATAGNTTTSVTINKPAGTAEGDVLYAVVVNGGANAAPSTVPTDWSLVNSAGGATWWGGVYRKVAGGAEGASYQWSGFTNSCTGCMVAVAGADTASPEHVHTARANAAGASGTAGLTTTIADTLVLSFAAVDDNQALSAWTCATDPATLTEHAEQLSSGGVDTGTGIAAAVKYAAGATGASAYTIAAATANTGLLIAVAPSSTAITGSADLAAETSLAASGTRRPRGTTTQAATGSLTATGTARTSGSADLAATTTLTASGERRQFGTAQVSGQAMLAASAIRRQLAGGVLAADGGLSAVGHTAAIAHAALAGLSGTAAAGVRAVAGTAALTAHSGLAAAGQGAAHGEAVLGADGTLASAGQRAATGSATLGAQGGLEAAGTRTTSTSADLAGHGDTAATGTRGVSGTSSLAADANLTAGAVASRSGVSELAATGSLMVSIDGTVLGAAALTVDSVLGATGTRGASSTAALGGDGALSVTAAGVSSGTAALAGAADATVTGVRTVISAALATGTGRLEAAALRSAASSVQMSGIGDLLAAGEGVEAAVGQLSGSSVLTVVALRVTRAAGALGAVATLTASAAPSGLDGVDVVVGAPGSRWRADIPLGRWEVRWPTL